MNGFLTGYRVQLLLKRALDIVVSLLGLILLSPIFALLSLAVVLESPGGAIYAQKRVGKDGKSFNVYKFRSMRKGGDDSQYQKYLEDLIKSEREGNGKGKPYRKMESDPRVTRVGKFLRRYYLDEMPQLINILKGEMSLVGPRPHVQLEVDHYKPYQLRRLSVKPGMTGLWQVDGKADCTFNELIALDLQYIDQWNFWLDIQILVKTVLIIAFGGEPAEVASSRQIAANRLLIPATAGEAGPQETADVQGKPEMPVALHAKTDQLELLARRNDQVKPSTHIS